MGRMERNKSVEKGEGWDRQRQEKKKSSNWGGISQARQWTL
jgi:hypothetical protein